MASSNECLGFRGVRSRVLTGRSPAALSIYRSSMAPPPVREEVVPAGPPTAVTQDMGIAGQLPAAVLWNVASRSAPEWRGVLKHVCRDFRAAVAMAEQEQASRSVIFMQVYMPCASQLFFPFPRNLSSSAASPPSSQGGGLIPNPFSPPPSPQKEKKQGRKER